ncbi:MAG: DNA gyrase/topoisomerase IV subunit A, partial [Saprospiraceae bacterium]|nr:DNA gyrase/topoisomerase IV subunit A [Saprospiraceae bacterium]
RIAEKVFVGKDIVHVDVWKKGDERTTYHLLYVDGKSGRTFGKRFNVTAITRDREYDLTKGGANSKSLYFSVNPNGESEIVTIHLSPNCRAHNKVFDFDFGELAIKGRSSQGNTVTKYPVRKVTQKELGQSTLGAISVWMDEVSGRLNTDERGLFLGKFDTGDQLLLIYQDGTYEVRDFDSNHRFQPNELVHIGKFDPETVISAVYFEGNKGWTVVKRFQVETTSTDQKFNFLSDHPQSKLLFASIKERPQIQYSLRVKSKKMEGTLDL